MGKIESYYPIVGFNFRVSTLGDSRVRAENKNAQKGVQSGASAHAEDSYFQSVSGLSVQVQTETWKEGGENRFEHTLPVRTKYSDLVLKRGIIPPSQSFWTDWFKDTMSLMSEPSSDKSKSKLLHPQDLLIELLNEKHEPLVRWTIVHAWPKNWKINDMNAERGEVLIESLELNYNYFIYDKP